MVLGGIGCVLGEVGELTAEDDLVADPCGGAAVVGDLTFDVVLAGEGADLGERFSGRVGAEYDDLRSEPEVGEVVGVGVWDGQGRFVRGQERAHPDAGEGDVGLHVHAVGAVVGAGDVAEAGVIEVSDVAPECGFDVGAEIANVTG